MTGRVFAIVGPSGVGKDTLLAGAVASDARLHWAKRVITRPTSAGGEPFEGVTAAEFEHRLKAGDFALHWQAHGLSYGIPKTEAAMLNRGHDLLFNGSRAALEAARTVFPDLKVIRISAPSTVLAERLAARGRETREEIAMRLARASYDLPPDFDVIDVRNDGTPDEGIARLRAALQAMRQDGCPTL